MVRRHISCWVHTSHITRHCVARMNTNMCGVAQHNLFRCNMRHTTNKHMWTNTIQILLIHQKKTCFLERSVWTMFCWECLWGMQNIVHRNARMQRRSSANIGKLPQNFALFCSVLEQLSAVCVSEAQSSWNGHGFRNQACQKWKALTYIEAVLVVGHFYHLISILVAWVTTGLMV